MPYAFAFHYDPARPMRGEQAQWLLSSSVQGGPLDGVFETWRYVPRDQTKVRAGRPYDRRAVVDRIEDPKVASIWLRSPPNALGALCTVGASAASAQGAAPGDRVVLIVDDARLSTAHAVSLAQGLVFDDQAVAGVVTHHSSYAAAEAIALGAFDDGLAQEDADRAVFSALASSLWGEKIRGPGWMTYLSPSHLAALDRSTKDEIRRICEAVIPVRRGALIQLPMTAAGTDRRALQRLSRALGDLVVRPETLVISGSHDLNLNRPARE